MAYYFEGNDYIYVLNKTNPKHIEFKDNWGMKDETIVDSFDFKNIETYIGMIDVYKRQLLKVKMKMEMKLKDMQVMKNHSQH